MYAATFFPDDAQLATSSTGIFAITLGVSVPIASNFNVTVEYYVCELHIFNFFVVYNSVIFLQPNFGCSCVKEFQIIAGLAM